MKKINLFFIPILALSLGLFSCDDNDDEPIPNNLHQVSFEISAQNIFKVTNTENEEVIVDENYTISNIKTIVTVIHKKENGEFVGLSLYKPIIPLKNSDKDVAIIRTELPEGEYYISFIALKDTEITKDDDPLLKYFKGNYNKAVMEVPNDYVHYITKEIKVTANETENIHKNILLNKISVELYFEFVDAHKVSNDNTLALLVGVEDVPSAFYIATGKTLLPSEATELGIKYNSTNKNVIIPPAEGKEIAIATFHSLANDNLPEESRGKYWFEFKEKQPGGKQIKAVSEKLDKFEHVTFNSALYIYELYDDAKPTVKIQKTELNK